MLVWLDLETTGLSPATCVILEVGLIVTDANLNILAEQAWVVHQAADERAGAHEVVQKMHDDNKLWAQSVLSILSETDVEHAAIRFLEKHGVPKGQIPLAGNTIGFDRSFLAEYMEDLLGYFHYRSVDVSTFTELAKLWYPEIFEERPQSKVHRALDDLHGSLQQLRYYRERILRPPGAHRLA